MGNKVHRRGVARAAKAAAARHKRPCRSAPATPDTFTLTFVKREVHHREEWMARAKWSPVVLDVAGRALTVESYEVQLRATNASGVPVEVDGVDHDFWTRHVPAHGPGSNERATFYPLPKPKTYYFQARMRTLNRVHGGRCWSAWTSWTTATKPSSGALEGPPAPSGLSQQLLKDAPAGNPWRLRAIWNRTSTWTPTGGDELAGASAYKVEVQTKASSGGAIMRTEHFTVLDPGTGTTAEVSVHAIRGKRYYRTRVAAFDQYGHIGAFSSWTGWASPRGDPDPPTNIAVENPLPRVVRVTWDPPADMTDVDRFKVRIYRGSAGTNLVETRYAGKGSSSLTWHVPRAEYAAHPNASYSARVNSVEDPYSTDVDDTSTGSSSEATSSNLDSSTVADDAVLAYADTAHTDGSAPSSSPTPTIVGGPGYLLAKWTAITNADPVMYEVHMSTASGFTADATTKLGEVSGTFFTIVRTAAGAALAQGTTYYVKLIAKDADGSASAGSQGSGTTSTLSTGYLTSDGSAPGSSPTPTVTSGPLLLNVSWTPVSNSDLVSYKVFVRAGSAPTTSDATYQVGITPGSSFVITKLADGSALTTGTTYYVKLVATDSDGSAAASSSVTGTVSALPTSGLTSDGSAPGSSPTPTLSGAFGVLVASWTPVSNSDLVTYKVYLSTSSGFTPGAGTLAGQTTGASFVFRIDPGTGAALVEGTTYYCKIVASDADGSAAASAQASATMTKVDGTADVVALSITAASIAANTITAAKIAAGTITATEIAASTITGAKIAANTITAAKIAAGTITATEIAASTITGANIAAGTITAGNISVSTLSALSADLGTITAGTVTGATLRTAASGRRVVMDPTGITLYDSADGTVVSLSTDPDVASSFSGTVLTSALTAVGATLQGSAILDSGAALKLISGVSQPITAPGVALLAGGSLAVSTSYWVSYSWYDSTNETVVFTPPVKITTGFAWKSLSIAIPPPPSGVTQARIYMNTSSFAVGGGKLQATLVLNAGATTTTTITSFDSGGAASKATSDTGFASTSATVRPASSIDSNGDPYGWSLEGNGRARFLGATINSQFQLYDDWFYANNVYPAAGNNGAVGAYWWAQSGGTTGNVGAGTSSASSPGIVGLQTGTNAAGAAMVRTGVSFYLSVARFRCSFYFAVDTNAGGTNSYNYFLGLSDNAANADEVAASDAFIGLHPTSNTNSTPQLWVGNGTTATKTSVAGGADLGGGTFHFFEFEVDAARSAVKWWFDGVRQTDVTTNIPGSNKGMVFKARMLKTAGTTSRQLNLDACALFGDYVSG